MKKRRKGFFDYINNISFLGFLSSVGIYFLIIALSRIIYGLFFPSSDHSLIFLVILIVLYYAAGSLIYRHIVEYIKSPDFNAGYLFAMITGVLAGVFRIITGMY
ncbi:MAG TPA: hypothetical protein VMC07_00120 [Candidatus Omnitrophota bacterium]|nr:hypothetical protein [Candidatus Omnitrophota bacterium]